MTEWIKSGDFHAATGVEDWRVLYDGAYACFRTASFAAGVALVGAIGAADGAAERGLDVDLRPGSVTVRLSRRDTPGLSAGDPDLARRISEVARELGATADPSGVQVVEFAIQALDAPAVRPFWRAVLGWAERGNWDLLDATGRGPTIALQHMDAPRPQRNRVHVDISVPHDEARARVAAAIAAGGRLVDDEHAPAWWVLADPEDNEACVATWMGRD